MAEKRDGYYSRLYGINSRCCKPNNKGFHRYGGRGIRVCTRWSIGKNGLDIAVRNFRKDLQEAFGIDEFPHRYSIDRIDPDGHYEIENIQLLSVSDHAIKSICDDRGKEFTARDHVFLIKES